MQVVNQIPDMRPDHQRHLSSNFFPSCIVAWTIFRIPGRNRFFRWFRFNCALTLRPYFILHLSSTCSSSFGRQSLVMGMEKACMLESPKTKTCLYLPKLMALSAFGFTETVKGCLATTPSWSVCVGSTTPKLTFQALYQVRCGSTYAITNNPYYFASDTLPNRPCVCEGQSTERPEYKLLGLFDATVCAPVACSFHFEEDFC
jgi:hypothetical protein